MSEVTPGQWEADTDQEGYVVIHSPTYYNSIVVRDGEYLSVEDAALIVRDHNAHDPLVEALENLLIRAETMLDTTRSPLREFVEARAAVKAAKP